MLVYQNDIKILKINFKQKKKKFNFFNKQETL
jgi:hypothetical protein